MTLLAEIIPKILPFCALGILFFVFAKAGIVPPKEINNQVVIPPKVETEISRPVSAKTQEGEEILGSVVIKNNKTGDKLALDVLNGYLVLPQGVTEVPKYKNESGLEVPVWSISHIKKEYWFDLGTDLGVYGGYLLGTKNEKDVRSFDTGIKFSPCRIAFNYLSPDLLIGPQGAGIGLSFYPRPERFGKFWDHAGIGIGREVIYTTAEQHTLVYFNVSTRF